MTAAKSKISDKATDGFTSMIDIVFLLLIFFILQPFKAPEMNMGSDLPRGGEPKPGEARTPIMLQISVDANDSTQAEYRIDGKFLGRSQDKAGQRLRGALIRRANGVVDTPVALSPDTNVHFSHVLTALDQCKRAGMTDVKWEKTPLQ